MVTTSPPLPFMDLSVPLPDISAEALRHVSSLFPHLPYAPGEQVAVERVVLEISKQAKLGFTCVHLPFSISNQFASALEAKELTVVRRWWINTCRHYLSCIGLEVYQVPCEDTFITWGNDLPPPVLRETIASSEDFPQCKDIFVSDRQLDEKIRSLNAETNEWNRKSQEDFRRQQSLKYASDLGTAMKSMVPEQQSAGCLPILVACGLGIFYFL